MKSKLVVISLIVFPALLFANHTAEFGGMKILFWNSPPVYAKTVISYADTFTWSDNIDRKGVDLMTYDDECVYIASDISTLHWGHFICDTVCSPPVDSCIHWRFNNSGGRRPINGGDQQDIFIVDSTIYLADKNLGIVKLRASHGTSVCYADSLGMYPDLAAEEPVGIYVDGEYVYVACQDGQKLCRIDTLLTPGSLQCVDLPNKGQAVAVAWNSVYEKNFAYIAYGTSSSNSGLASYDVSGPTMTFCDTICRAAAGFTNVWVDGDYAYVTQNSSSHFLKRFDVSDPYNITYHSGDQTSESLDQGKDVEVFNDTAYVAVDDEGLAIVTTDGFDIVGLLPARGKAHGVTIDRANRLVIVCTSDSGTYLPVKEEKTYTPKGLHLSVEPNPFNSKCLIKYDLPISSYVKFTVHNILGSEIAVLKLGKDTAGEHKITWIPPSDFPSGVYFIKLSSGDAASTGGGASASTEQRIKRVTLLK